MEEKRGEATATREKREEERIRGARARLRDGDRKRKKTSEEEGKEEVEAEVIVEAKIEKEAAVTVRKTTITNSIVAALGGVVAGARAERGGEEREARRVAAPAPSEAEARNQPNPRWKRM